MSNTPSDTPDFDHLDLLDPQPPTDQPAAASPSGSGPSLLEDTAVAPLADASLEEPKPDDEKAAKDATEDSEKETKPGLFSRLAETDPYSMLLVVSLVCILIGCGLMYLTWQRFNFDTKARGARGSAAAVVIERGLASSTAIGMPAA